MTQQFLNLFYLLLNNQAFLNKNIYLLVVCTICNKYSLLFINETHPSEPHFENTKKYIKFPLEK